jgi:hypothetical protein
MMRVCPNVRTKVFMMKMRFSSLRLLLNRFRVAFASLLFLAALTSTLAGWGLVGSAAQSSLGMPSIQTSNGASQSSGATTTATATQTATTTTTTASGPSSSPSSTTSSVSSTVSSATVTRPVGGNATTTVTATATTTVGAGQTATVSSATAPGGYTFAGGVAASSQGETLLKEVQAASLFLAPVCWILVGGAWIWRGRVRSRYTEMGFGSDVFELFMKMKGGATRIKVLNMLNTPKDRLQLAQELGVDWKTVDRHVQILNRYGFVREQAAYGTVRLYEVTPMGKMLLSLFDDLERTDGPVTQEQPSASLESSAKTTPPDS